MRAEIYFLGPIRLPDHGRVGNLLFDPVACEGHQVPDNKKDARDLDETPAPLRGEAVLLEPICQYSHGKKEKHVCQLMRVKTLGGSVRLKGPRGAWKHEHKNHPEESNLGFHGVGLYIEVSTM